MHIEIFVKDFSGTTSTGIFDCSWHKHIDYIKGKARTRMDVMCEFKYTLDRKTVGTTVIIFLRPILEYADVILDNCTQQ